MKPVVFIGSSSENLSVSRAIQNLLHREFEMILWTDDVFQASKYYMDALAIQLDHADFGIFVLEKDDLLTYREDEYVAPRDNVIFELGLFIGKLGRERVFFLVPNDVENLKLPSDLDGISPLDYCSQSKNQKSALGPACNNFRELALGIGVRKTSDLHQCKFFNEVSDEFQILFKHAKVITLLFVHSRRWRENHTSEIEAHLEKDESRLIAILPDLTDQVLVNSLKKRFDDGRYIEAFISDSYRFFSALKKRWPHKVSIRSSQIYPAYSLYKFDDRLIYSIYPSSSKRKPTPTYLVPEASSAIGFFEKDMSDLIEETKELSLEELAQFSA